MSVTKGCRSYWFDCGPANLFLVLAGRDEGEGRGSRLPSPSRTACEVWGCLAERFLRRRREALVFGGEVRHNTSVPAC
jgi:hypothetical protein